MMNTIQRRFMRGVKNAEMALPVKMQKGIIAMTAYDFDYFDTRRKKEWMQKYRHY